MTSLDHRAAENGQADLLAQPCASWRTRPEFQDILNARVSGRDHRAPDDVSRRGFLGAVAASVALAGMASCRKPETHILRSTSAPRASARHRAALRDDADAQRLRRRRAGQEQRRPPDQDRGQPVAPEQPRRLRPAAAGRAAAALRPGAQLRADATPTPRRCTHAESHGEGEHGEDEGTVTEHGGGHGDHEVHNVWEEFLDWLQNSRGPRS